MRDAKFVIINRQGMVAMRSNMPALKAGQVAVLLMIEVPDAAFEESFPEVHVTITEEHLIKPTITAEVMPADEL